MIEFIVQVLPWWAPLIVAVPAAVLAFRYFGINAALLVAGIAIAATVYARGRKTGAAVEVAKQQRADTKARETIHDIKEDVRSIPSTPAGSKQREERFNRWSK